MRSPEKPVGAFAGRRLALRGNAHIFPRAADGAASPSVAIHMSKQPRAARGQRASGQSRINTSHLVQIKNKIKAASRT